MSELATEIMPNPAPPAAVVVEDPRLAEDIAQHFDPEERRRLTVYDDARILVEHPEQIGEDVAIVSFHVMRNLAKVHLEALTEFCRRHKVVLLIRSQDFLDAVAYLELADGVVFQDATLHRLKDILTLSTAGYSILPSAAVMDIVTDRLRIDTIARLSPVELSILDQIRLAKTNRAIARSLSLTEANVKTKVRAILKALKFQNRTEAAVFAARQGESIRDIAKRRTEEVETDAEGAPLRH
ncbi:MAG: response regulator transcription factor [Alphaproteobacteria bacterium]|nr:response regulator transcription factor [Alphaproteobacteria bacterium]